MNDAADETQQGQDTSQDPSQNTDQTSQETDQTSQQDTDQTDQSSSQDTDVTWPDDWRDRLAGHFSAGDEDGKKAALKNLERYSSPEMVYAGMREMQSQFNERGLIKKPGEDVSEEDIAAFHQSLGAPEKPDGYIENLELSDDITLGDMDKSVAEGFSETLHREGVTQNQFNALVDTYVKMQEQAAEELAEADDQFDRDCQGQLKEEWGDKYKRNVNAMRVLFADARGGMDIENPNSLIHWFATARGADGRQASMNPELVKQMHQWATIIDPQAAVVDDTVGDQKSVDQRLQEIRDIMRTNRRRYNTDTALQDEFQELLTAQKRIKSRDAA